MTTIGGYTIDYKYSCGGTDTYLVTGVEDENENPCGMYVKYPSNSGYTEEQILNLEINI